MPRSSLVLSLSATCALGLFGSSCTHQLPTWGDAGGDNELAQADTAAGDVGEPVGSDPAAPSASADTGAAEGGQSSDAPDPDDGGGEDAGTEGAAQETGAKPDRPPLPKPLHSRVDKSCGKAPGVGQRVKGFKLPSPSGKNISPGNYRGRVVLLNFWGTWCKPCLKELPEFDRLFRRYRKHGLTVVAVATDDDAQAVQDFVSERKLSTKVAIKGESAASQYGARTFPFSFIVDHKGVIRAAYNGYKPNCMGKLEDDIRKQLAKLPPK